MPDYCSAPRNTRMHHSKRNWQKVRSHLYAPPPCRHVFSPCRQPTPRAHAACTCACLQLRPAAGCGHLPHSLLSVSPGAGSTGRWGAASACECGGDTCRCTCARACECTCGGGAHAACSTSCTAAATLSLVCVSLVCGYNDQWRSLGCCRQARISISALLACSPMPLPVTHHSNCP